MNDTIDFIGLVAIGAVVLIIVLGVGRLVASPIEATVPTVSVENTDIYTTLMGAIFSLDTLIVIAIIFIIAGVLVLMKMSQGIDP